MAQVNSSMSEYERLMNEFQPAIANRDKMVSQYCGAVLERPQEECPQKGGLFMMIYRLFGGMDRQ